jgi:hypothetical protein
MLKSMEDQLEAKQKDKKKELPVTEVEALEERPVAAFTNNDIL